MIQPKHFSILLALLAMFSTFSIIAQPCVGGLSDGYPCDNVALASRVNTFTLGGLNGNDIWGYNSPGGREYALMGMTTGVSFVDVTVPTAPVVIGFLESHNGTDAPWRDIREKDGYAYIGADAISGHGIQIFDLSQLDAAATGPPANLPVTFSETSHISFGVTGRSHNIVTNLDPASTNLYVVGQNNSFFEGVTAYDISTPTSPVQIGTYNADGYSHDMLCINYRGPDINYIGQEICIGFNEDLYSIIDMTDKNNIIGISTNTYPGVEYTHQGWISDDHKYLMLDDELDERNSGTNVRTYIFDISDLANPVPVAGNYYEHNITTIDHNMFVKGPYLYQANYEAGLRILNIGDLDNGISTISEAGFFDILPSRDTRSFNGAWGVFPYLESGSILLSGIDDVDAGVQTGGLFVLTPDLPHHYLTTTTASEIQTICPGDPVSFTFNKNDMYGFSAMVNYTVEDLDPALTGTITTTASTVTIDITNTGSLTDNTYFRIKSTPTDGTPSSKISGAIILTPPPTAAPLLTPPDNSTTSDQTPSLIWTPDANTDTYDVVIATDPAITNVIQTSSGLTTNQYTATSLQNNRTYYWQVTSTNTCGETTSTVFRFTVNTGMLPVELVSFTGEHRSNVNYLNWSTASEINNAGFEIQRQQAGQDRDFEAIGWVEAASPDDASYEFKDEDIRVGARYYYRLKQVDLDGNFEFSPIITLDVPGKDPEVILYPNPVQDQFSLDLFLPELNNNQPIEFSIFSFTGQEIQRWSFEADMPSSSHQVMVEYLSPGTYIGIVSQGAVRLPVRFVKW